MKHIFKIIIIISLSSCSTKTDYIIDPRGSKDPKEVIRDRLECRELIKPLIEKKHETILGIIPFCTSKVCMKFGTIPDYDPMKKCLVGRGHSVLN